MASMDEKEKTPDVYNIVNPKYFLLWVFSFLGPDWGTSGEAH
jgi:hypothetical protein